MKTFELTQEQINQLAEEKHAKELLQQFIPEAFETKLEVGKWYKKKEENNKTLFVPNKEICDDDMGYGFTYQGIYKECGFDLKGSYPNNFELATEEEVREALINEAKKRGFKEGVVFNCARTSRKGCIQNSEIWEFNFKENWLSCKSTQFIFNNGVWAEIIEETKETEPTKEEINRVLTFLKNKNEQ